MLNFEDEMQYSVIVQAEGVGTIVSGSATQIINIDDVNEQPQWVIECSLTDECMAVLQENLSPRDIGIRLEATDADLPSVPNGQLIYRIVSNDPQFPFSINDNGQIQTTQLLDRENREMHTFTVIAADGGNPSLSVSTTFRVMVTDVNDEPPVFIQGPETISLPENEPTDTVIAQYITTDRDTPPNARVTYTLAPSSNLPFELNSDDGVLTNSEKIDYENPDTRVFTIVVTADNPPLSSMTTTLIQIMDVNDNEPVFDQNSYSFSVPEHSDNNTAVGSVTATDADSGLNGAVYYSITAGNSQGYFSIDEITGEIIVSADIDRELVGSVELKVRAKDRGSPNLLSTVMVTVTISDINDNPPIFNPEVYFVSVREDISTNSQVITVFATDADKPNTDNSRIVYSIQSGNTGGVFRIDDTSGVVVLINPLNHENISSYTLTIRADDQGIPQLSDNAIVEVTVINVNEAPPILSGDQTIDVSESTPTGVIVASFSASDPDFMTVSISILSGNDEGRFQINSDGDISIAIMLDFETTETYTLTIEASDGESTDLASLFVNVLDENEFTPEFFGDTLFILNEEVDNGTLVGTITANDGDGSAPNNVVTYSFAMQNSIEDYFFLDGSSGRITTADVLDREMLTNVFPLPSSSLSIQVFARDGGSPSLQSSRVYTITLLDINDNNPEFGNDDYSNSIFENQPPQVVMSFTATDSDLGENAEIHFSFTVEPIEGATLFDLGDDSIGEISTTQGLDCEIQTSYIFTLTATDRGTPRRSASITSTLTLRDQNDNSPIFTEDPYIFMVDENIAANSIVGQVIANDTDKGVNGEVFYEIIGQDEDDLEEEGEIAGGTLPFFEIDSDTGEIQHVTPFDFESFPTVNITIKANDRGTPRQSSITMVIFNITNVDEFGPRFTSSCDDVSLSENTPINTVIVNCMAIDLDNTTTADDTEWITYSIISGNTDDTFSIGLNDGIIRNAIELDYETNSFFRLTVIATDGNELSRRRIIDIIIEDENDNAPTFQMRSFSLAMTSEAIESNTQMIARARAIDDDSGSNGDVQYSIDDDDIVRVSETETQVTITARDGGDKPQTATATLKVTFDEECLLQKYTVDPNTGVVMTQVLCSVEVRPVSTDVVVGDNHTAYCHIVRNSPAKYQWLLNGNAIDLTVFLPDEDQEAILNVESVGFQDAGSYACKVTTEAGSLQTATYTINILVIPVITVVTRPTAVLENDFVKFSCFAVGTPTPMIHWEYQGRIVGTGNTITIEKADESTQGNYSCVAVSSAGSTNQDTRLIVYVTENVAEIVIRNVDQPSPDGTCHYLDPEAIESVLSSSGMSTMITDILAENVCEINSCSPNPCNNGGRCQLDDNVEGGYSCTCANGYTGVNCIEDVDECLDGPCGPSGECRNVRGLFQCMCTDSTGNRCQYSTICIDVNNICNDGELCMESLESLSGYTCIVPNSDELLSVIVTEIDVGFLDDIIVNYREALLQQQQQATDNQIKRATEESLIMFAQNNCNPRFLQLDPRDDNLFGLFWDCPDGEFSPPVNIQSVLCEILVESRLVVSCQAANMSLLIRPTLPPSLPKISVTIQLIQVDSDTGEPLSIGKTLNNLQDIAEEFAKSEILPGAEVDSVSAVIPIVCTSKCVNGECTDRDMCTCNDGWTADVCDIKQQELDQEESSTSTGVIVGVVVALVVCIILVIVAAIVLYIVITKHCEHQKRQELKKKYARELNEMNLSTLPSTSPTKTNSAAPPLHTGSTEMINSNLNKSTDMLVEDNDYDQLPALVKPSTVQPDTDNDYDQLPAMVNKSVPKEN